MNFLKVHLMHNDVVMPSLSTEWSSCFDMRAHLFAGGVVKGWDAMNNEVTAPVHYDRSFDIQPGYRMLVPTGIIFDLDKNQGIRVHPRSGMALKKGLGLANCEGVIDADYTNECFLTIVNNSAISQRIVHGERYAQAELVENAAFNVYFGQVDAPGKKTSRDGGFGSTGSN